MIHVAGQAACHTAYETTREASYILSDYKDFKIVAVDCGKGPKWGKVCYNYSFHSYPDFRFFKNGEQVFSDLQNFQLKNFKVNDWDGDGSDLNELIDYIQTMRAQKDEL